MKMFCKNPLSFFSLGKVIDWLLDEGEIEKSYHFLSDNCQDFAKRLFETVAKTKKYPDWVRTTNAIWTSMAAANVEEKTTAASDDGKEAAAPHMMQAAIEN